MRIWSTKAYDKIGGLWTEDINPLTIIELNFVQYSFFLHLFLNGLPQITTFPPNTNFLLGILQYKFHTGALDGWLCFSYIDTMDCYMAWLIEMVGYLLSRFLFCSCSDTDWTGYTRTIYIHRYCGARITWMLSISQLQYKMLCSMRSAIGCTAWWILE